MFCFNTSQVLQEEARKGETTKRASQEGCLGERHARGNFTRVIIRMLEGWSRVEGAETTRYRCGTSGRWGDGGWDRVSAWCGSCTSTWFILAEWRAGSSTEELYLEQVGWNKWAVAWRQLSNAASSMYTWAVWSENANVKTCNGKSLRERKVTFTQFALQVLDRRFQ